MAAAKAGFESEMQTANNNLKGHLTVIRQHAKRIKTHASYTTGIGENLGIIGDEQTIDVNTSQPGLNIFKIPVGYQVDFNLLDFFDGINLYRKRPADANFSLKAFDDSSPYIDTDAQVNGTQYYAFYVLNGVEVGVVSATVTVQV
jgi:hypothetical protein